MPMIRPLFERYEDDLRLFPHPWHKVGLVAVAALALWFPFHAGDHWLQVGNHALVAIVGAVALMMLTGFAGQISLGHAAFLAVGAYTVAVLGERFGVPFWLALPAAGLASTLVGLAVGPFALRLEGLYLAIVTIGLLFLVNHVLMTLRSITHGASGIAVRMHAWFAETGPKASAMGDFWEPSTIAGIALRFEQKLYFVFLAVAALAALAARNVRRSNTGRAMMAVRDHDLAAAVLGVHPAGTKIVAFGLSSFFAGVAGGMFAFQAGYITVSPPFNLDLSVQYIAMIVLGGIGTVFGAVAGAVVFVMLRPLAEKAGGLLGLGAYLTSDQQATLLFSLAVIGFLLFEPWGLEGIWRRIKRYFQAWPFRYVGR